jgi:hypothetical protein
MMRFGAGYPGGKVYTVLGTQHSLGTRHSGTLAVET